MSVPRKDVQLVVRVPEELADRLDTYAEELRALHPGPSWNRSDVVRMLLTQALEAQGKKAPRRR